MLKKLSDECGEQNRTFHDTGAMMMRQIDGIICSTALCSEVLSKEYFDLRLAQIMRPKVCLPTLPFPWRFL